MTLLDPGDEVLLPDPGWPNYRAMVHVLGGDLVGYPVDLRGGTVDPDARRRAGHPADEGPARQLAQQPDRRGLHARDAGAARRQSPRPTTCGSSRTSATTRWSTACATRASPRSRPSERLISVFSFSKTYAMTGWRLGYVVAPRRFADELLKEQEPVHGNASSVSQKAAEAALAGDQSHVAEMRAAYGHRRDLALATTGRRGRRPRRAAGRVLRDGRHLGARRLDERGPTLLQEQHVSTVPGLAFGPRGEGWARVSLCVPDDVLAERAQPRRATTQGRIACGGSVSRSR